MGGYSVLKEIGNLGPQGTMVKKNMDGFHVFKHENSKGENCGWRTGTVECILRTAVGTGSSRAESGRTTWLASRGSGTIVLSSKKRQAQLNY